MTLIQTIPVEVETYSKPSFPSISFGGSGTAALYFNIKPENTSNVRTAFKANSANIPIAFMGDSTMRGVDETASPYNSQYMNSMPHNVAINLRAAGYNAICDNWYGLSGTTFNDYMIRDGRLTSSGLAILGSQQCQGGANVIFNAGASTFNYTSVYPCTKADIYWRNGTAGNDFTWAVDGGSTTVIPTTGSLVFTKTTISLGTLGIHTVNLAQSAGSPQIYGIDCYDDTQTSKQINIRQWGTSGGTASLMIANAGTPAAGRLQQLSNFPPKLVLAETGPNDWRGSTSVASVKTSLQTLITAVKTANCDFIFITPPYDNSASGLTKFQDDYVAMMYDLAVQNNVGLIDIRKRHGSFNNAIANGWQVASDAVHLTGFGYKDEATAVVSNAIINLLNFA